MLRFSLPMWRGTATIRSLTKRPLQPPCACIALWSRSRSPPTADTFFSSTGDGVVAEFPSIVEAIRCAIEIQNEIAERNSSVPEKQQMQFRIGVNLGDVIAEDNNLYGTGVNVAVRLEQLAEPGGICISQTVYDQVRKIVEIPFEDIGERHLKNIAEPIHVYRILPSPLPWLKRLFSRRGLVWGFSAAAGVALDAQATDKKLSGAAKTSFTKKCEKRLRIGRAYLEVDELGVLADDFKSSPQSLSFRERLELGAHRNVSPSGGTKVLRRGFQVEVEHDHIVVRVTGTSYAASYYRMDNSTGLVARNLPLRDDHRAPMSRLEFIKSSWELAKAKAQQLNWI